MIKVSTEGLGFNFIFDRGGVEEFIGAFERLGEGEQVEVHGAVLVDRRGAVSSIAVVLGQGSVGSIKRRKLQIEIFMDAEDVEYSLYIFAKAKENNYFEVPEWIQVTNLSTRKNIYLCVSIG